MKPFLIVLIVLGGLLTAATLIRGVLVMAGGKDLSGRTSNKLMWYRVFFQGLTIAVICVLAALKK